MKTEAAVLWELNGEWEVREVDLGEPLAEEVRVRLAATGICHTDDHIVTGDRKQPLPAIGGHEGAGIVEAVGANVRELHHRDHVVLLYVPACGLCDWCAKGLSNLCDSGSTRREGRSLMDGTCRFSADGRDLTTTCMLGTFARHTVVHHSQVLKIAHDIPLVPAALVGGGVTAGFGAAVHCADVRPGETVVVVGIGGLGVAAIQGADRRRPTGPSTPLRCGHIVGVDPVQTNRDVARMFGATHVVGSFQEAEQLLAVLTSGRMSDVAILTTGLAQADMLELTMRLVGKRGRIAVVAVAPAGVKADVSLNELTFSKKQVRGSLYGSISPRAGILQVLDLYPGHILLDEMITALYELSDINQAFADMKNGKNVRGVVVYDS